MFEKILFCDLETTGTDPQKHGIHQMSCQIWIKGKAVDVFDFDIRPFPTDVLAEGALEVSGRTVEQVKKFEDPLSQKRKLVQHLKVYVNRFEKPDKFWFIGYNAKFDYDFFHRFFKKCGDDYCGSWVFFPPIDVAQMAALQLRDTRPTMKDFKLVSTAKALGIEVDEDRLHDAAYDIDITVRMFFHLETVTQTPAHHGNTESGDIAPV